jgi:hypothetical protein
VTRCERWRDSRVDPHGLGLHGVALAPGDVVRFTQDEVEAHPAWRAFGSKADHHPPLPDWLATPVCSEDGRPYGLLQLSDKAGGANFTEEEPDNVRALAALAGATLDALLVARGPSSLLKRSELVLKASDRVAVQEVSPAHPGHALLEFVSEKATVCRIARAVGVRAGMGLRLRGSASPVSADARWAAQIAGAPAGGATACAEAGSARRQLPMSDDVA